VSCCCLLLLLLQLSALVLSQLLQRCPDMSSKLRAVYLIGDTEPGGRSACLSMDTKVRGVSKVYLQHAARSSAWIQRCEVFQQYLCSMQRVPQHGYKGSGCFNSISAACSACLSMDTKLTAALVGDRIGSAIYLLRLHTCIIRDHACVVTL
jgi:hypothetical protein